MSQTGAVGGFYKGAGGFVLYERCVYCVRAGKVARWVKTEDGRRLQLEGPPRSSPVTFKVLATGA